ncbi:MAG: Mrp/NBP35 family ATP-binding protein [Cystobacterineae bacterium]|nr:Mrp/NBP35 family ATP-binding protein [Cystobacterineae bacterium]
MSLTENNVRKALAEVLLPGTETKLLDTSMLEGLKIEGDKLSLTLKLPAADINKEALRQSLDAALGKVPGLARFQISWAFAKKMPPPLLAGVRHILLVGAGKGGVGKSTIAVNLAYALAAEGAKVGLLDADFYGPSLPLMSGVKEPPYSKDGKTMEPLEAHGVRMISIGFLVEPNQALVWRGPMLHAALSQLMRDVNWGSLDWMVVDLPPGTGDVVLSIAQHVHASGAILVSTPQKVALADVIRARQMFASIQVPVLGMVENMSRFICPCCGTETPIFDAGGARAAAKQMDIPFLGEIPMDMKIRQGGDTGLPLVLGHPESPEAKQFRAIARQLALSVKERNLESPH